MEYINNYFIALWELTTDMAPYLLLGFLFAGLLKVFLPANIMNKYLGNSSFKSVVNASILGVPLPLCSCGVLPAGISLYKNGASKGSSVSFLISTPQTGVDSIKCENTGAFRFTYNNIEPNKNESQLRKVSKKMTRRDTRN